MLAVVLLEAVCFDHQTLVPYERANMESDKTTIFPSVRFEHQSFLAYCALIRRGAVAEIAAPIVEALTREGD